MQIIQRYFPHFTAHQLQQFDKAFEAYQIWNERINVVSRKDIAHLPVHHMLHSLAIAHLMPFKPSTLVIDVGTGGGFPGIPLAIAFPEASFLLVDSIGKKLKVVEEVAAAAGLSNVRVKHTRIEQLNEQCDFVTGRAVETIPAFYNHVKHLVIKGGMHTFDNGILYLKGGDFAEELKGFKKKVKIMDIAPIFEDSFFETKKLVYIPF